MAFSRESAKSNSTFFGVGATRVRQRVGIEKLKKNCQGNTVWWWWTHITCCGGQEAAKKAGDTVEKAYYRDGGQINCMRIDATPIYSWTDATVHGWMTQTEEYIDLSAEFAMKTSDDDGNGDDNKINQWEMVSSFTDNSYLGNNLLMMVNFAHSGKSKDVDRCY